MPWRPPRSTRSWSTRRELARHRRHRRGRAGRPWRQRPAGDRSGRDSRRRRAASGNAAERRPRAAGLAVAAWRHAAGVAGAAAQTGGGPRVGRPALVWRRTSAAAPRPAFRGHDLAACLGLPGGVQPSRLAARGCARGDRPRSACGGSAPTLPARPATAGAHRRWHSAGRDRPLPCGCRLRGQSHHRARGGGWIEWSA